MRVVLLPVRICAAQHVTIDNYYTIFAGVFAVVFAGVFSVVFERVFAWHAHKVMTNWRERKIDHFM